MNENVFSEYDDVVTVDDVAHMLKIGKNGVYDLLRNKKKSNPFNLEKSTLFLKNQL